MRRHWPANLEPEVKKSTGVTYYRYRDPVTGETTGLGTDFEAAAKAVQIVNARRAQKVDKVASLLARIEAPTKTLHDFIGWFVKDVIKQRRSKKGKPLSPITISDYENQLEAFEKIIGADRDVAAIDGRECAEYLNALPATASNRHRSILMQLFDHAIAQYLRKDHPIADSIKRDEVILRKRLEVPAGDGKSAYEQIYETSPVWFKSALNLARRSIQRGEDLVVFKFADYVDGVLAVRQQKLAGRGYGLLKVKAGPELDAAVRQCQDALLSPYMVHRQPERKKKTKWRTHWTQISRDTLTREFARIRDELKLFEGIAEEERPTFHEIRAMGAREMELSGHDKKVIQALLGHRKEDTTLVYLDRHKERWENVISG